ncbi:odorant receptor 30a-like [Cochliomyia hominivorax]
MDIKTIEDVPMFISSLRIMKFWAFLLDHNWRRYASLIPYALLNITQFMEIYFSTEPVDAIIRNAYIAVLFFNSTLRGVVLSINRFGFEKFMEILRVLYIELRASEEKEIRKMLNETSKISMLVSKVNLWMGAFSVLGFLTYPIFSTSKALPYGIYVPGIDKYQRPFYEIFFVAQIVLAPMGCCMFIPFTNLVVAFILFAILMCKVLQYKLSNLKSVTNEKAREVIVWCLKYHLELIRVVDTMNSLTTHTYMIEFLAFGAMLCAMLFSLVIAETLAQMIIISIYMFMIFSQSVVLYYFANELYDQSLLVAIAAYDCSWFDFDVTTQKILKLMILRAQKPCAILVGKVYPMNLELLQSLLNATYSYFTLLKRVYG